MNAGGDKKILYDLYLVRFKDTMKKYGREKGDGGEHVEVYQKSRGKKH